MLLHEFQSYFNIYWYKDFTLTQIIDCLKLDRIHISSIINITFKVICFTHVSHFYFKRVLSWSRVLLFRSLSTHLMLMLTSPISLLVLQSPCSSLPSMLMVLEYILIHLPPPILQCGVFDEALSHRFASMLQQRPFLNFISGGR